MVSSLINRHTNTNTHRLELHNILIQMLYYLKINQANNGNLFTLKSTNLKKIISSKFKIAKIQNVTRILELSNFNANHTNNFTTSSP